MMAMLHWSDCQCDWMHPALQWVLLMVGRYVHKEQGAGLS